MSQFRLSCLDVQFHGNGVEAVRSIFEFALAQISADDAHELFGIWRG